MRSNVVYTLVCLFVLSGCAGFPLFNNGADFDREFDRYIANLKLEEHPLTEARAILLRRGFECESQGHPVAELALCYHVAYRIGRNATVTIVPDAVDASRCVVKHSFQPTLVRAAEGTVVWSS